MRAESRQGTPRLQKSLLRSVLGVSGIAEHPERDPEDGHLMPADELLEGVGVAGSCQRDQCRVAPGGS